jgi:NADH-ubiquinone oxidoreductase chain 5
MYLLLILLPLLNTIVLGLFGKFLGKFGSNLFAIVNMFISLILALFIFYEIVICGSLCFFKIFSWLNLGVLNIFWGFIFDPITAVMLLVVTIISFFVHLYSIDYMADDAFSIRFMAYLSLFTWFMFILVTSDNLLQLFVGWEGVGLVSFLLINFWFSILESNKSALKAMVLNRVGDVGLVISICLIFNLFKTLDFTVIFPLIPFFSNDFFFFFEYVHSLTLISLFILLGAIGKSAQFGLHTWLPDAMAGPTPVSALIHAATMVTAGVFVIIRLSPIFEFSHNILFLIAFIGVFTSFFAGIIGIFQNDIKKIIAYSTCSQLGYMIFICGLSNYSLSLFHLSNHAFFKALLFLSAGAIIHGMFDEQDIRRYGGLVNILPYSYIMVLIGSLALMGIPFLTGFYSKDLILEIAFSSYVFNAKFMYFLSIISAIFTSIYSLRLIYFTFLTKANGFKSTYKQSHDAPFFMFISLFVLAFFSIFFGFFFKDLFIGLGTDVWINAIGNDLTNINLILLESEFLNFLIKNIPFLFTLIFSILSVIFFLFFNFWFFSFLKVSLILKNFYNFFSYKWYIDVLYNKIIVGNFFFFSYCYVKHIDRGLLELFGPLGIVKILNFCLRAIPLIQTGLLYNYLFIIILSSFFIFINIFFQFDFDLWFIFICIILFLNQQSFYSFSRDNIYTWR